MKITKLFLMIGSMLLVGSITVAAQSADAEPSSPNIAQFPVVNLGPEQQVFDQNVKDVLFDYDDHIVDTQAQQDALNANAEWLKANSDARLYIDGYADERGDIPYNMTLSQKRAEAVKAALVERGVPEDRILITVGFGKLYPICAEEDERCLEENRRVHLVYVPPSSGVDSTNASK
jgi:peptidoglycan-associated lipoprotein